ncbi:MAG: hypothetical protein ABI690_21070 [Chloroflexota bacterium]
MEITQKMFAKMRHPRRGKANPERIYNPVWKFMVQNKESASWARLHFETPGSPVWSFDRFGMSETILSDGRVIYIAGEHEDYYDSDFYIYNDVIIIHPDGEIAIYGYKEAVFPPTDFHSATRINNHIYIIGRAGYWDERILSFTPVYRLNCDSLEIERLVTSGDYPGWISNHEAKFDEPNNKILIQSGKLVPEDDAAKYEDNFQAYQLDLATLTWQKVESPRE